MRHLPTHRFTCALEPNHFESLLPFLPTAAFLFVFVLPNSVMLYFLHFSTFVSLLAQSSKPQTLSITFIQLTANAVLREQIERQNRAAQQYHFGT